MKVLVACEFSGVVREAFLKRGHEAYSCDIYRAMTPPSKAGTHLQQDVTLLLRKRWDLVIAHPPCTYLCNSGVRWFRDNPRRWEQLVRGVEFFNLCLQANALRVCVENPIMHLYAMERIDRVPDQIIHPYQFGHPTRKATCLWLKFLPYLIPTSEVKPTKTGYKSDTMKVHSNGQLGMIRSITYQGIADAMAEQWGCL